MKNTIDRFQDFAAAVAERLQRGAVTYGDQSFQIEPDALATEVEEELFDVCAWSFILWCRVRDLRGRL